MVMGVHMVVAYLLKPVLANPLFSSLMKEVGMWWPV